MRNNASLWLLSGVGLLTFVCPALAGLTTTPEPSSGLLIAGGLGALILLYRRQRAKK